MLQKKKPLNEFCSLACLSFSKPYLHTTQGTLRAYFRLKGNDFSLGNGGQSSCTLCNTHKIRLDGP